jgi:hypothetical protein
MQPPNLAFACELDTPRLTALFTDGLVIDDLKVLRARVLLMLSDYSVERARVVQRLNTAGVPVTGIPLVPVEDGYYFTPDNVPQAYASYEHFKRWTVEHGLIWADVGLDIEPEADFFFTISRNPWGLLPMLASRVRDTARPRRGRAAYESLVARIHADGWSVENYQMPLIADERRVGSTLLQRLFGLVDLPTDREVWMQYNSFMRGIGPAVLWSYGPEAAAIAVGTTGGGPVVPNPPQMPTLSWEEFARDLRLARHWSENVYVHSLEGCVEQGYLSRLRSFDWTEQVTPPEHVWVAKLLRTALRSVLWASAHPRQTFAGAGAAVWLIRQSRRRAVH